MVELKNITLRASIGEIPCFLSTFTNAASMITLNQMLYFWSTLGTDNHSFKNYLNLGYFGPAHKWRVGN